MTTSRLLTTLSLLITFLFCLSIQNLHAAAGDLHPLDVSITGGPVLTTVLQPDGRILVGGSFTSVQGVTRNRIARFYPDGTLDTGFNPNANSTIESILVQADGKIIIGGIFTSLQPDAGAPAVTRNRMARLNADGTLDPGFNPNVNSDVLSIAEQADGKIVMVGRFSSLQPNGAASASIRNQIARLNADGTLDTGFNPGVTGASGGVYSLAIQTDGKIVVVGLFSTAASTSRNNIARLNANGTLDTAFNPNASGSVNSIALQRDGKILIGGEFSKIANISRGKIARLNANGTVDTGFNPSANEKVYSMVPQADGKIVISGFFTTIQSSGASSTTSRGGIARLNADGTLDMAFDPQASSPVYCVAMQADGGILAAGYFTTLQPNGSSTPTPRASFAKLYNDPATQTLTVPVLNQAFWTLGGSMQDFVRVSFQLSTDGGTVWTPLGAGTRVGTSPVWRIEDLALPSSGLIRALGVTSDANGSTTGGLIASVTALSNLPPLPEISVFTGVGASAASERWVDSSAHVFASVPVGESTPAQTFTIKNTGLANLTGLSLSVSGANPGDFTLTGPSSTLAPGATATFTVVFSPTAMGVRNAVVRLASNDADENPFNISVQGTALGSRNANLSAMTSGVGGLTPAFDTAITSYNIDVPNTISSMRITPIKAETNASISIRINEGGFTTVASGSASLPLALNAGVNTIEVRVTAQNGTTTNSYNVTVIRAGAIQGTVDTLKADCGIIHAAVTQPDGKTILAGAFTNVGGVRRNNIARLNADGTLDTSFDPNVDSTVSTVALQPDGKILIGGAFILLQPNGASSSTGRNYLARLNADGTLDTGFDPNPNELVNCIVPQPDGKLLIGGSFTAFRPNGAVTDTVRNHIARLNVNGTLDTSFNPNVNGDVASVVVQTDGKILLGGFFIAIQPNNAATPTVRNHIARVNANGTLDTTFNPNSDSPINCLALQPDGKVLLGGQFTTLQPNGAAAATSRNRIARLNSNGTLDTGFNPNADSIVNSIAIEANGRVLIGGQFNWLQPNGAAVPTKRNYIARVGNDGTLDIDFDPNTDQPIRSLALQADGKVLLGGMFSALFPNGSTVGAARSGFARLLNDPATQSLTVPNSTRVRWMRGGSSPEVEQVTFEVSTNNGASYTLLGAGTRITGGWELTGLSLPNGLIRARGRVTCGSQNGSGGMMQTVIPYGVAAAPEIVVSGNSTVITNGSTIASPANNTDFGVVSASGVGSTRSLLFIVTNTGAANLTVGAVGITGANAADFAVIQQPSSPVAGGDSTAFTILFDPSAAGLRKAVVSFTNGDADEGSFQFNIQGTGFISDNANLINLHPSNGELIPAFSTPTTTYTTKVAYAQTSISATFLPEDVNASISIRVNGGNYSTVPSGSPSGELPLNIGVNTIEVLVTAQDGVTTKTYTLAATRASYGPGDPDSLDVPMPSGYVPATAVQPDGKTIIGGYFTSVGNIPRDRIARFNQDDSLDMAFDPKADAAVVCLAVQADGKIILGGQFTSLRPNGATSSTTRMGIARLNTDGTLDTGFNPNTNGGVSHLTVLPDGKILIGGTFTTIQPNGTGAVITRNRVARLNEDGTVDTGFDPNANSNVCSLAIQQDGKILIAGNFTTLRPNGAASPTTRNRIARLNADGTLDASFTPGANDAVNSVLLQVDGKILLGGNFTEIQPTGSASPIVRKKIARCLPDGTLDMGFDLNAGQGITSMALQADQKILIGGMFEELQPNGGNEPTNQSCISRLNPDGTVDQSFNPRADSWVSSVALQADGRVLLSGQFTLFQPNKTGPLINRLHFARLYNSPATQSLSTPDATRVNWTRGGSSPEVAQVTFELSTDGGTNYVPLGNATRVGLTADWQLTGLNLPTGGQLRARGRTSGGYQNGSSGIVETVISFGTGGSPLAAWRQTHFGSPANAGDGADNADSDHDGLVNLIEYAFGLNPKAPDANLLPKPVLSGENLTATFTPPAGAGGVTYGAQWSENLTDWHPATDMNTAPQRTFSVPMADRKKLYMRLTVTAQ